MGWGGRGGGGGEGVRTVGMEINDGHLVRPVQQNVGFNERQRARE